MVNPLGDLLWLIISSSSVLIREIRGQFSLSAKTIHRGHPPTPRPTAWHAGTAGSMLIPYLVNFVLFVVPLSQFLIPNLRPRRLSPSVLSVTSVVNLLFAPGNAVFVPPPHTAVPDCMAALERFLHEDGVPILLRAGLCDLLDLRSIAKHGLRLLISCSRSDPVPAQPDPCFIWKMSLRSITITIKIKICLSSLSTLHSSLSTGRQPLVPLLIRSHPVKSVVLKKR